MTTDYENDVTDSARPTRQAAIGTVRIALAWLLTVLGLPYTWGRCFIGWQLTGRPETWFALALLLVVAAVVALTYGVGAITARRNKYWLVGSLVGATWVAVNVAMFWFRVESSMPRGLLIAAYLPGSLLVPWSAWMFFGSWGWRTRLAVTAPLLALLLGFVTLFRVDGLSGSSNAMFSWRRTPSRADRAGLPSGTPNRIDPGDQSIAENPDRDFPQFLGPDRTGVLLNVRLDRDWTQRPPRELWRRPIGGGWSSFAVVGDYAYTQEQRGERECVVCYRLLTGDEVWSHSESVNFTSSLGGPGPRATPTVSRSRVFAVGATGVLNCLDALTGRRVWSVDILKDNDAENIAHGVCASPLVVDDWVVVCPTGSGGPSLVAYDRDTGERVWGGGKDAASYASPILVELGGERQFLLINHAGLTGHDCVTGDPLWHFAWTNTVNVNVSQPIVHAAGQDHIFVSTGYDKGCALIRVDHSANGTWSAEPLWSNNRLKTKFCSAVVHGSHVYGLDDGILACVELATGNRAWKGGRYGHGQVLLTGDSLIVQAEQGDVVLVEPNPRELRELGRIKALSGKTWNNPTLAGPYLLVRNDHEATCYELPLTGERSESQSLEATERVQTSP
jgi:outer membrane protein assembly factor BamB